MLVYGLIKRKLWEECTMSTHEQDGVVSPEEDRRAFLKSCGRFAAVTPPAVTMLLSTSLTSGAIAKSGSGGTKVKGNNGFGNGANGTNPGSFQGAGVPQGGPGAGQSSSGSKGANVIR